MPGASSGTDNEGSPAERAEATSSGEAGGDTQEAATETDSNEFKTVDTHTAKDTHGVEASKLAPTKTEALLKLIVVDKVKGPVKGIVVSLQGADSKKVYAPETDAAGYTEVLVPVGQKYDLVYLSLEQKGEAAQRRQDDKHGRLELVVQDRETRILPATTLWLRT